MKLIDFFKNNDLPLKNKTIIVAVSSGPDSMALLQQFLDLKKNYNLKIIAAHINHQLRQGSDQESEVLEKFLEQNRRQNLEFVLAEKKWPISDHPKKGLEAAARDFRYNFFNELISTYKGDYLVTAHHGDDLLENMLIKLIRSGNLAEINSLKPIRNFANAKLIRPLLSTTKNELEEFCQVRNIPYLIDQTNSDDFTIRNRLRHQVVPLLKDENQNISANAFELEQQMTVQEELLGEFIDFKITKEFLINDSVIKVPIEELIEFSNENLKQIIVYLVKKYFAIILQISENYNFDLSNNFYSEFNQDIVIQGFRNNLYIFNQTVLSKNQPKVEQNIQLNQKFEFIGQKFLITTKENSKIGSVIGTFYASKAEDFIIKSIKSSDSLQLKNGQHQQPKKKFSEVGLPEFLRPYCLTIQKRDSNFKNEILFIKNVYQNQVYNIDYVKYYVYQVLKKAKEK